MTDAPDSDRQVPSLSPTVLRRRLREGDPLAVLDVRDREEFEAWHVDGEHVEATQIPYAKFMAAKVKGTAADLVADLAEPILVVCGEGKASAFVAETLLDAGVEAMNLEEGMDGWARVYETVELPHDEATVLQYQRPSSGCLAYLVVGDGEAVVVDPLRAFADRFVADARERGAELVAAVDTHVHADHVSGVRDVARETGCDVVLPSGSRDRGLAFDARLLDDGESVAVGDVELTALATPGHTTEATSLRLGDLLFCGDTVFLDGVARPDLEVGEAGAEEMARTLYRTVHDRFFALPPTTRVAPGHFGDATTPDEHGAYVATLADLRERLAALSMDEDEFVEFSVSHMPPQPANYETIVETNLGRHEADEEEAFELELGPNNCAVAGAAN
ncbi:Glyoxylase, beta-lactamase superfamily II [Halogranum amylolyticum]|uniref:Glyoxylase, beta-lactamase superfamily II n=1 Tax=Halogranum amylolyticum TaxID=660520 RepID=A0A1H8SSU9_9EURY|nr:Glyoxylase, beta-lactamase superfamily II [Halogranum amylolyticum]